MLRTKHSVPEVDACHAMISFKSPIKMFLLFLLFLLFFDLPKSAGPGAHRGKDRLIRRFLQQIARGLV
jgi:hypothetical protein